MHTFSIHFHTGACLLLVFTGVFAVPLITER